MKNIHAERSTTVSLPHVPARLLMAANKRDVYLYQFLKALVGPVICRYMNFKSEVYDPACEPYLVVSNHNTDFDPIFVGRSFKKHMYFVASEHVFRWGWLSTLLIWALHPIARVKGSTDATAALSIIRKLRNGTNVCLFAEGNRSYTGVTGHTFPATGKLVKSAKAALVTYHIQGGYLATPRWASCKRRGPIKGKLVNIYTAEQIKSMSPEEINEAIRRDLYEDAFERQLAEPHEYKGKQLAEKLEYALYVCPKCGRIDTLHSKDDRFRCDCGLAVRYNTLGFFEGIDGEEPPFTTVRDWDRWQNEFMAKYAAKETAEPLLSDTEMELQHINAEHKMETVAKGTMTLTHNTFTIGSESFRLDQISDMALVGKFRITFITDTGEYYQIRSDALRCGRKYVTLFQELKKAR